MAGKLKRFCPLELTGPQTGKIEVSCFRWSNSFCRHSVVTSNLAESHNKSQFWNLFEIIPCIAASLLTSKQHRKNNFAEFLIKFLLLVLLDPNLSVLLFHTRNYKIQSLYFKETIWKEVYTIPRQSSSDTVPLLLVTLFPKHLWHSVVAYFPLYWFRWHGIQ